MTKGLESADHIAKLFLSGGVILSYFFDWISGPSSLFLLLLALVVLLTFIVKIAYRWITLD